MPTGKRVDPDSLARLRGLAEQGLTAAQAAARIGLSPQTVVRHARRENFAFRQGLLTGAPRGRKPAKPPPPKPPRHDFASPELRREIEAAKREAASAPLFRGGSMW